MLQRFEKGWFLTFTSLTEKTEMKRIATTIMCLTLSLLIAGVAQADDKAKKAGEKKAAAKKGDAKKGDAKKGKKGQRAKKTRSIADRLPAEVKESLSAEQKEKIAALDKEFGPQMMALNKERLELYKATNANVSADLKAKLADARKKKDRKAAVEAQKAINASLSAEDKKKSQDLQAKQRELGKKSQEALASILTADQKSKIKKGRKGGQKKDGAKKPKKDGAKKPAAKKEAK